MIVTTRVYESRPSSTGDLPRSRAAWAQSPRIPRLGSLISIWQLTSGSTICTWAFCPRTHFSEPRTKTTRPDTKAFRLWENSLEGFRDLAAQKSACTGRNDCGFHHHTVTVPHPLFGFFKFTDQTLLNFSFEKTGRDLQVTLKAVMHKV